jgi:hypothetical protein
MRVSEALAVENKHFTNNGRTITVEQQVKKDSPKIVRYPQDQRCQETGGFAS